MYRKRYRRGTRYRKRFRKRGGKVGRWRGRRYIGTRKPWRKLKTNFAVNDYRTVVVSRQLGTFQVDRGTTGGSNAIFKCNYDDLMQEDWSDLTEKYEQFYVKDITFVIEPKTISTSNITIRVDNNNIPYLVARPTDPNDVQPSVTDISKLRMTSAKYIPIMKKRRTRINVTPVVTIQSTFSDAAGGSSVEYKAERYRRLPWLNTTTDGRSINFAQINITRPQLDTTEPLPDGFQLSWGVSVYATVKMRGNKNNIIPV